MSVETAVAIAGGFTPRAQKNRVEISRPLHGQIFRSPAPLDVIVRPGDTIVVGERWF
jgi:polysaccharide export outer membrane protein